MISKMLVAVDGSKQAMKSVQYAAELAGRIGATIILISVIDRSRLVAPFIPAVKTPTHLMEPVEDYLSQAAEAYLEDAARLCRNNNIQVKKVVRKGHPVEEILKEAERSKVDLIALGSHGRSALKAAVLGSVSFGVISRAGKIPVLVIRG
ncbi:MAG: universal stress protein [Nitrospirota bacterium]